MRDEPDSVERSLERIANCLQRIAESLEYASGLEEPEPPAHPVPAPPWANSAARRIVRGD